MFARTNIENQKTYCYEQDINRFIYTFCNNILRLQQQNCSIEAGFIWSDLLTNLERTSDHCSNVAGLLLEMEKAKSLDMHKYLDGVKHSDEAFRGKYEEYREKYAL